jgi:hypothetical protein
MILNYLHNAWLTIPGQCNIMKFFPHSFRYSPEKEEKLSPKGQITGWRICYQGIIRKNNPGASVSA